MEKEERSVVSVSMHILNEKQTSAYCSIWWRI